MQDKTIEQMAAQTILEQPQEITIGGISYKLGDPSIATLILVSELVSQCPIVEHTDSGEQQFLSALHHAKDFRLLGDIAATLILGAKNIKEKRRIKPNKRSLLRFWRKDEEIIEVDKRKELAPKILEEFDAATLWELIQSRLMGIGIGYFFQLTTSLSDANILRPTKEVEKED